MSWRPTLAPLGAATEARRTLRTLVTLLRCRVCLLLIALLVAGCGRGYEGDNRAIVSQLPTLDGVSLIEENHYGYCSGDSCLFGNDRSGALLTYSVDTNLYTQETLVEAYSGALSAWNPSVEEGCANADPSYCDEIVFAHFLRGEGRIDLNLDNWTVGRFELHVDAKGDA